MITRPTVLVLGAGASVPYHFPTGAKLFADLTKADHHRPQPGGGRTLVYSTSAARVREWDLADDEALDRFTKRLTRSGEESVDAFLANQSDDLMRVGKLVMAAALTSHERDESLFEHAYVDQGAWYRWLWKQLDNRPDRLLENQLTIVTFNYDRSLEYFLAECLQHRHDVPREEALQLARQFPIIHVHGQLGGLGDDGTTSRPYVPPRSLRDLEIAAMGITVISEVADEDEHFDAARDALANADRVHFLGFAFDPRSLKRLGFQEGVLIRPDTLGGSTFRMTPAEIEAASEHFTEATFVPGDPAHNVLQYLRHVPRLDR